MKTTFFQVAVNAPLSTPLTYSLDPSKFENEINITRGTAVQVPLGKRKVHGVVLGETSPSNEFSMRSIDHILSEYPPLHDTYIKWVEWLAQYYMHPIGRVIHSSFPPLKRGGKRKSQNPPVIPSVEPSSPPKLTDEQKSCLQPIIDSSGFQPFLLHGVTGSGKTEVYLQILERVLSEGQTALVLVPEISLTPQLIQRFAARFPEKIAVIHSHLTEREKTNQWWSVVAGEKPILVGARSAMFCPMKNLGAVIVDEEHEPSFKQDEKLKYHGRDAAVVLAKLHGCPIILGSATPSLESWQNAQTGKYSLLQMKYRVAERKMPTVEVVDLKQLREAKKGLDHDPAERPFWMSPRLQEELTLNLEKGMQSALFLNRRGTAQMALCTSCGTQFECPNCAISLTLHGKSHLVCHYCDFSQQLPHKCASCESEEIETIGLGTELLETDLQKMFPQARLARADRDEISGRKDLEALIRNMDKGNIDILVGTQMIAKGLDFPKLTVVGLVLADIGFNLPDFRATERSFQLLTQVSGRAGRHVQDGGKVIIQTYNPGHSSIKYAKVSDYESFAEEELKERKDLAYPPFGRVTLIRVSSPQNSKAEGLSSLVYNRCEQLRNSQSKYQSVQLLGPCPAPLMKIRNTYRHQLLLKTTDAQCMQSFCYQLMGDQKWIPSGSKVQLDVDPINML